MACAGKAGSGDKGDRVGPRALGGCVHMGVMYACGELLT